MEMNFEQWHGDRSLRGWLSRAVAPRVFRWLIALAIVLLIAILLRAFDLGITVDDVCERRGFDFYTCGG